ncbi:TPR repeat protein [Indibacter alkaliphilus LW1]|uniref:TPR repeat protein n=1 Tax=Indibacter alkaliphilus (strain CCUG 57479 / KCTC 22604 / LW1) TaxID=1189612 RepID=S2DMB6_INDAL|nr:tetratricopeptide repeat protein [Indibacter alkaliphilus]EOZ98345.1 TPR repeat protein [Indibacter alkaliphilus LW1]
MLLLSSCLGTYNEGEYYFQQQEYEKAVSMFSNALFINVTDVRALHMRARSYEELEDFALAKKDYEAILKLDPKYAQAHAGIGKLFWKMGDFRNSEIYLLKAAQHDPEDFEIIFLLGRAMIKNRRFKQADEFFQIAKQLEPEDARVYYYQGMARSQIGDLLGAAGSFNMSLKYDPDNLSARYNRGICRMMVGHSSWAVEDFDHVLKIKPDHIEALARRGNAKINANDPSGCQDLQEAANKGSWYAKMWLERCG